MGIHLYVKGSQFGLAFKYAQRLEWEAMDVEVNRYGKTRKASELWCVLYDAYEGGTELGRFKGSEVIGFTSFPAL